MTQLELWTRTEHTIHPAWSQLDLKTTSDLVTRLALLMVKAINAENQDLEQQQEDAHERQH
jgi:hypothetical protein